MPWPEDKYSKTWEDGMIIKIDNQHIEREGYHQNTVCWLYKKWNSEK